MVWSGTGIEWQEEVVFLTVAVVLHDVDPDHDAGDVDVAARMRTASSSTSCMV